MKKNDSKVNTESKILKKGSPTQTIISNNSTDITFQISDWDYYHENIEHGDDTLKKYIIRMYGTTKDNKKVFVKVKDYTPYFFVEIPKTWTKQKVQILIETVKNEVAKSKSSELVNSLKDWDLVDKNIFWEFSNYKLFTFVRLIFHSYEGFRAFERVFNRTIKNIILDPKPKKYKIYESNIEPLLRCMHIRKLNSVGWVNIKGGKYNHFSKDESPSTNEISVYTDWIHLDPVDDKSIASFTIASFDLECTSGDGNFPQPHRDEDKIIQIGTTFSKYGESECYFKHIITLNSCDPIEGATVESYDNEASVLLAWTNMIRRMNPDVMTGYNIFGFDYKYLEERAKKLGCYTSFSKLGRIKNDPSPFIEKTLTSSALGENKLNYYAMQGRVQIDIMKVVQRDHKLGSYKLDNVAAEFIRESVDEIVFNNIKKQSTIKTKSTYGLDRDRYIKIYFNDGLSDNSYKNEAKFKVIALTDKSLTIDGILDDEATELKKYKVYWCQAKDDVSPNDIFRMQKETSKARSIIAKYCLQDCSLCNKLINKLQILTNNIGMANVCHVPLSYIFLRGQGVKIFSLVSKKCRERNHVVPVIKKPYKPTDIQVNAMSYTAKKQYKEEMEEEEEAEGYEGATVFEPNIGVHYEPITVLDYNSLYPNSMRFRNVSHECIVKHQQYDNLPGYTYEEVTYSNKDGTTTTCKYAKSINGPPGILCEILTELLNARTQMKDLAEIEEDPFQKKILDSLQLAYKVTANSLYGQCGAPTSPLYMKDIAASTTATGREMLNAARIFAEIIFPIIIKLITDKKYVEYEKTLDLLFNKKIDELIGEENVKILQKHIEGEVEPRYFYLGIFKNNRDVIDDKKFINKKSGLNNKKEFIKWFYDEVTQVMNGKVIEPDVIYGDTDSIFIKYNIKNIGDTESLKDKSSLETSILLGILTSKLLYTVLPSPQNMLYEKTFWPFVILSKKRYVGNKYETDSNKYYQNSMGIVLKRRDNAPIVKIIVGGIVRSILNDKDPQKAVEFTKNTLRDILCAKYPLDKFIITKTLKGNALTKNERKLEALKPKEQRTYAERTRIVHAVLADRIADRDPGNKPSSNDRIPYAYVITEGEVNLQGERVEHPDYIIENKLPLDYLFYITNQIMKPSIQFLEHIINKPEEIFERCIIKEMNRRTGKRPLNYYFNILKEIQSQDDIFGDVEDDEDHEEDREDSHRNYIKKFTCYVDDIDNIDDIKISEEDIDEDDENTVDYVIQKPKIGKKKINTQKKIIKKKVKRVTDTSQLYDNSKGGFVIDL